MRNPLAKLWHNFLRRGPVSSRLHSHSIESSLLNRTMEYSILSPPEGPGEDLPVFYVLHGMGDTHLALDRFGVSDQLFTAMEAGRIPRAHLVMPRGDRGFWIDWYDGSRPYESYVVREILPAAEELIGGLVSRERRHLIGVSMGGMGALHMGLRNPELFASVSALSAAVLNKAEAEHHIKSSFMRWFVDLERIFGSSTDTNFFESHNPYCVVEKRGPELGQRLFMAAGTDEKPFFTETGARFAHFLKDSGVDHEWSLYKGGHGWRFWAPVIERAMNYATAPARG